jgi:hypothetical protein
MGPRHIAAWTQLYDAVGLLAAICSGCALLKTIYDIRTEVIAPPRGLGAAVVAVVPEGLAAFPAELSLRFPSILAIAILYAHYIGFAAFVPS